MSQADLLKLFVRNRDKPLYFHISEDDAARLEDALLTTEPNSLDFFQFHPCSETLIVLNLSAVHAARYVSRPREIGETEAPEFKNTSFAYVDGGFQPVPLTAASAGLLFNLCWELMPAPSAKFTADSDGLRQLNLKDLVCLIMRMQ